jgi:N6-adenosine-specific RNA methylase IME4
MKAHEYAKLFPMATDEEIQNMADDIKQRGLLNPIIVLDDEILDGRNRHKACELAGVIPKFKKYTGKDALGDVVSWNLHRRQMTTGQRAALAVEMKPMFEKLAKDRMMAGKKSEPCAENGQGSKPIHSAVMAGKAVNVGKTAVKQAEAVKKASPEIFEKVKEGKMTLSDATRDIKKSLIIEKLENIEAKEVKAVSGVYDVIVIDPPWPMVKIERDVRPNQSSFDYPTMTEDEISKLKIPSAEDCHVWVWTTHKFLPMALRLLDVWDLKYVCCFTWHKNGGMQPIGLPQYNCEFALYARKGTPKFIDTKAFPVCFHAERGSHSEKPEEFYEVVRRVTGGRRLDMFNRRSIQGFDSWGNEAQS